jgi:3-phosphoshikimate 1-carboxyvinyltransferase
VSRRLLDVDPLTAPPDCDIVLPGSKSITNRALVAASLADGRSTITNALDAEDTRAMIDCCRTLGATIDGEPGTGTLTIDGTDGAVDAAGSTLWVRQSGTTARFMLPLAARSAGGAVVDGDDQIRARPQGDLLEALAALGARIEGADHGRLPVRFAPATLHGGTVRVPGSASSQFISGLLLCAPTLSAALEIELTGEVVSAPYLAMTVAVMRRFGATVEVDAQHRYLVEPSGYQATDFAIEPDASTASYFFAAAAVSGGRVGVAGLGTTSIQGDTAFVDVLEAMGAEVARHDDHIEVRGPARLSGVDVSMRDCSDTAPTLAAIAPRATGPVVVREIGFIRAKESDRIAAVVTELGRLGVTATDDGDGFTVHPATPHGAVVETYDDHRIAMAFTVLGLVVPGVTIADPECVTKTFPAFFDAIDALRARGDASLAVLAIDGPAGSGKSTVSKLAAQRLGLEVLDTGAMYRGVTLAALRAGIEPADAARVAALARHVELDVGAAGVFVDGVDSTAAVRSPEVNASVSVVAANPGVRASLRRQQRAWTRRRGGGVLEGRDIGSVVFPDARRKVYLNATPEERARRRSAETGESYDEILAGIAVRDSIDSGRADSPLIEADNAVVIDTTGRTIDEVVDAIVEGFA